MKKLQIKLTPKQKKEAEVLEAELKERTMRGEFCSILAQLNLQSGAVECVILDAETSKDIAALIQQRGYISEETMENEQRGFEVTRARLVENAQKGERT